MKKLLTAVTVIMTLAVSLNANAINQKGFDRYDTDADGYLNVAEYKVVFSNYLKKKGVTDPAEQDKKTNTAFNKKDANQDGKLSIEEMTPKK